MEIAFGNAIGMTNASLENYVASLKPKAWFKSNKIVQLDNTAVLTWKDISGNGNDATQAVTANQPTFKINQINGKPAVEFDGSSDRLEISSSTSTFKFLHSDLSTIFFVGKIGNSSNPDTRYGLFGSNGAGTANVGMCLYYDDRSSIPYNNRLLNLVTRGVTSTSNVNNLTSDGALTPNQYNYIRLNGDPANATAANRSIIQINGGSLIQNNTQTNALSTSNSTLNFQLGSVGGGSLLFLGQMAEIIIFNKLLTSGEVTIINQYIKQEYDL
jgi:hypothetical protein